MTSQDLTGHCLCRKVTYQISKLGDAGYCHCHACRRESGAPVIAWGYVDSADFSYQGEINRYASSEVGSRCTCPTCGSSVFFASRDGSYYSVSLGTLTDTEAVRPSVHMCCESQVSWLKLADWYEWTDGIDVPSPSKRKDPHAPPRDMPKKTDRVSLREITKDKLIEVLKLDVGGPQRRYVATNAVSISQMQFEPTSWARIVYAGDTAVGFILIKPEDEDYQDIPLKDQPGLWRFMIDHRFQGLGFGEKALRLAIQEVRMWPKARHFYLSFVKGKHSPEAFYRKMGFEDLGVAVENEWLMRYDLAADSAKK